MEEQLISFNTAKLTQEKGFTTPNNISKNWYTRTGNFNGYSTKAVYYVCTQSLLAKWLREVHNIRVFCTFETIDDSETAWVWNVVSDNVEGKDRKKDTWDFYDRKDSFSEMSWFDIYEEAFEIGLQKGLKLI